MTESETSLCREQGDGAAELMRQLRKRASELRDGTGARVEIRSADGQVVAVLADAEMDAQAP